MVFRTKRLICWLNFTLIFCLVSQTLIPLLVLAEIPIATTKQVETSSPLIAPETQPPPSQPEIDFKQNPPFSPVSGLGVYLGFNNASRVELVAGTTVSGSPLLVDLHGDGNEEWVMAQADGTAMWVEVAYDFDVPAGSQWSIEGYRDYNYPFGGYYWDGSAWIGMGGYGGIIPVQARLFRFGSKHYYSPGIANGYPFHWDAFRIGGPGTRFPDDQGYGNECPICSNGQRHYVGGPIDVFSGNYSYSQVDITLSTSVTGQPLEFRRSYNSQTITNTSTGLYTTPLSLGWTHNYEMALIFSHEEGGEENTLILKSMGGSRLRFEDKGDGTFEAYPGINANLSQIGTGYQITTTNQTVYYFDLAEVGASKPQLLAIRDPKGNETTLNYSNGRLSRVSGPMGRYLDFIYDNDQRLTGITDHSGRKIGYGFDSFGRLSVMTNTRGLVWGYAYSGTTNLLQTVTNPARQVVEQTLYNEAGQAISQKNGLGQTIIEIAYPHSQVRVITQNGSILTDTFDGRGLLISQVDAAGNEALYLLDGNFEQTASQDGNGNVTLFAKNEMGLTTAITDALGYTSVLTYDTHNNLVAFQDARGYVTRHQYDTNNNLLTTTKPLGEQLSYTYNQQGQVVQETNENGAITTYGYDIWGNQTVITDALGNVTTFAYDTLGRLITTTNPLGQKTVNRYDAEDNLIATIQNSWPGQPQNYLNQYNLVMQYSYNGTNQPVLITNTLGQVSKNGYNQAGQLQYTLQNIHPTIAAPNYLSEFNLITQFGYNQFGRRVVVTNTLGDVQRTFYNNVGQVVSTVVNYEDGFHTSDDPSDVDIITYYAYNANGKAITTTQVIDSNAGVVRQTCTRYNALNQVIQTIANCVDGIFDPGKPDEDVSTFYQYDAVGNQIAVIDPLNRTTRTDYTPLNQVQTLTNPAGGQTSHFYDLAGNRVQSLDAENRPTFYGYDPLNRIITTTNAAGGQTIVMYNALGQRLTEQNAKGYVTQYGLDSLGHTTAITDSLGNVTTFTYDPLNNKVSETDAEGYITYYEYNSLNRLIKVTRNYSPTGPIDAETNVTTLYQYNALGQCIAEQNPNGNVTTFTYDRLGRILIISDPLSQTVHFQYDIFGNVVSETNAAGETRTFGYDGLNQRLWERDPLGNEIHHRYNAAGEAIALIDAAGIETRYDYNNLSQLSRVTENYISGGQQTTSQNVVTAYGYDRVGNRTVITNARGFSQHFQYDVLNRQVAHVDALNYVTQREYDQLGNQTVLTNANGIVVNYQFDATNRLTMIDYADETPDVNFGYNKMGHRVVMTDGTGITTYKYNKVYRPQEIEDGVSQRVGYTYDAVGNPTHLMYPTGQAVIYTYNAVNKLEQVSDWNNQQFIYSRDKANRLTHLTLPNGIISSYEYDLAGRLTHLRHYSPNQTLANYVYTLDKNGNRIQVTELVISPPLTPTAPLSGSFFIYLPIVIKGQSDPGQIINYVYDDLQRLVEARYGTGKVYQYDYDAVGNRVIQGINGITTAYQYDPSNRLSVVNGRSYTWDNNGNLLETGVSTNTFDAQNRLVQSQRDGTTLQPIYDGLNNRVAHVKNGMTTTFALDVQGLPEVIYTSEGNKYLHLPGVIVTENITGERRYLLTDGLGSVRQAVDENGKVVAKYDYDPYGNPIEDESNLYGFTGEWWESDLGLLHLRARWYMPEVGIFLSKDQWHGDTLRPQTLNGWNYVEGNPINLTDPSGLCSRLPQLGPSDCEKFVAEVAYIINAVRNQGFSDDVVVQVLAAYYSGIYLTNDFEVFGSEFSLAVPPGIFIRDSNFAGDRWLTPEYIHEAFDLDTTRRARGEKFALKYGFKRIFFDNTHHYFYNFYTAWFYSSIIAKQHNNRREVWQYSIKKEQDYAHTAADILLVDVAVEHMRQTRGWIYDDITILPALLRQDACGDTIEEIYQEWVWPNEYIESWLGKDLSN